MRKALLFAACLALAAPASAQIFPGPQYGGELLTGAPVTVAPIAVAANTVTLMSAANAARVGFSVQIETATTAPIYLCANGQSTTCSATVHDAMIPAGAAIGTEYYFGWPSVTAYYAVSAAAVTITPHSVVSQ